MTSFDPHGETPFAAFARDVVAQAPLRAAVTAATRRPEPECVAALLAVAHLDPALETRATGTARALVEALRAKGGRGGVEGLVQEYSLSSQEGVALMCLAEALLRVPDRPTRDRLIRDKIGGGDWRTHVGHSPSLFVNAATWGLVVTGKLTASVNETGLATALQRLVAKGGEPLIRKGVDVAMRMMGDQFVTGQTIAEALGTARRLEARGFRYSYDMLGEAAMTAADAARYFASYEAAIHAIGRAAAGAGPIAGPGISVKLSALHPRYTRAQRGRVHAELLPRLMALARLACGYDIALNIDAEEADRLELSLDLLEALCLAPDLAGWNGIGFVVQAYGKRASAVVDVLVDLAVRSKHRLMVRLVKGAYWDSEIKRAQVDGLEGYPVFTRKLHTDLSYIACAKKLLDAPAEIFPQFATHNARTVGTIHAMAGPYWKDQYEFQCLHGMGEPLYDEVVGHNRLDRPCRIYAPVGTHETLLAYLVRRLLENGANSSFVNRIADPGVSVDALVADPVAEILAMAAPGDPHPAIVLPRDLYAPARANALGLDLSNEDRLASLAAALVGSAAVSHHAAPMLVGAVPADQPERAIRNPADGRDCVGRVVDATAADVARAFDAAAAGAADWAARPASVRSSALRRAADLYEAAMPALIGLIVREAGKSIANALGDVREAVDFLRYYAVQAETATTPSRPLGIVACISPWNFPLAIFTGQVAAALAAGNAVLAKPAEETPLIAARAVALLREAGIPAPALQLLPGDGAVGAALVADARCAGVLFTGSTAVARLIQRQLAGRLDADGHPVVLVAETGGQNALVVDSSALPEQVVADVLASGFDSAGQRCSALRVLCLQDDIADRVLAMLKGAMAELSVGCPDRLATDVGPVIDAQAKTTIEAHVERLRAISRPVHAAPLPPEARFGTFVAPTLIEIDSLDDVPEEVFGPVVHVLRFERHRLAALIARIDAAGYGLTFGLHTRIDETVAEVLAHVGAGNVYVNRTIIGAVVGVQPFGGNGLSGTGPKAGGPLYLHRLGAGWPAELRGEPDAAAVSVAPGARAFKAWLDEGGRTAAAACVAGSLAGSLLHVRHDLPGPVGERNLYRFRPRGRVLVVAETELGLLAAIGAALATGNRPVVAETAGVRALGPDWPDIERCGVDRAADLASAGDVAVVLHEGDEASLRRVLEAVAARPGAIVPVHAVSSAGLREGRAAFPVEWLVEEQSISTNTAAAGGNASLMALG